MAEIKEGFNPLREKKVIKEKEKYLTADLTSGTNLYDSDPDKGRGGYIEGMVPQGTVIRVVFNFVGKENKGSNFANCGVKEIADLTNEELKDKLDIGLDDAWDIYPGARVYVNKVRLGNQMFHIKEKKKPEFKQPQIPGFPKIRKTR